MILRLTAKLADEPARLTDFSGPHLAYFQALCRVYNGRKVHVWFEDIEDRTPEKMKQFFYSFLIPYIMDITGDDNPQELERMLLHRFGFATVPFAAYSFRQMKIFIDALVNYFQIPEIQ